MNSFPEGFAWAILLLPVGSCVLITLGLRKLPKLAGYLTILCIFLAFLLSLWALKVVNDVHGGIIGYSSHEWLKFTGFQFNLGIRIDGLTAVMLIVVTSVSTLVQFYSQGRSEERRVG